MRIIGTALSIALLVGLVAAPCSTDAQPTNSPARIGLLPFGAPSNDYDRSLVEAFRHGLREVGVVENRDVVLDIAWIGSEPEISHAVSGLMQRGAQLLIPFGTSASLATKRQTSTVPILFISVGNPVGIGLVESLSRPGGNATGFSDILLDLSSKYVQFAGELGKPQGTIYYLWHHAWGDGQNRLRATERATQAAGLKLQAHGIGDIAELNDAMSALKKSGAMTIIVQPSPFTFRHRDRLANRAGNRRQRELVLQRRLLVRKQLHQATADRADASNSNTEFCHLPLPLRGGGRGWGAPFLCLMLNA